jgi:pilus assembly protein CpaB
MGRRTLLLIASILVAALGTALIWLYVQGADSRAQAGEARVKLMVAATEVRPGTPSGDVRWVARSFPSDYASLLGPTAIASQQALDAAGVATTLIPANVPLLSSQFGSVEGATTTAPPPVLSNLAPGKEAITLTLPDPQRLAGLLQANSLIRVYITTSTARGGDGKTWVLLPSVKVLSAGPATGTTTSGKAAVPQANVALEVSDDQAKQVISAMATSNGGSGSLWFALLGPGKVPDVLVGPSGGVSFLQNGS